ncbi:hypothetical protein ILUMI_12699 [Ignelater luminosus]|uniref:SOCS box domain-containing protein n=1 Tax=Ignelater luminosus TaxID=2038154 RepID=A0A8K0GBJ3_IGNLU|nr:hypothetical protein ILUMI_12699 [Ignelater luminosus]
MNSVQHGLLLHKSIIHNDFPKLNDLLETSKLGINEQNQEGDTPLLSCLKWERFDFIEPLLSSGASVVVANNKGITPLSFTVAHNLPSLTHLLLERSTDTRFMYDTTINANIHEAFKNNSCEFNIFALKKESGTEIVVSVQVQKVIMGDVMYAYEYYGFNQEVVVLLQHLEPSELGAHNSFSILDFLIRLEGDPKLSIDNLENLDLIARSSYRKLINSLPRREIRDARSFRSKKQLLNAVPTLFELSRDAIRMNLAKFYNVESLSEFSKLVENLPLPKVLKTSISKEPPLYYYVNTECLV